MISYTHVFLVYGFRQQADDDDDDKHESEQNHAEVQVVDVLDDSRPRVVGLGATWHRRIRRFPCKPGYADRQTDHETPECALYNVRHEIRINASQSTRQPILHAYRCFLAARETAVGMPCRRQLLKLRKAERSRFIEHSTVRRLWRFV